ncbi:MAG TPA: serine/threonine-protein kinase [Acidimicrobiales bacterium]|nr:serine/threonine-protein kinase [Acidimicrobiales bacterium]
MSPSSASTVVAGRYQLGELLGRGGMAEVRAGTDLRLQRPVAVKFLLPEMAARDDIRRRFEAEACAAASLSDPHAVAVFDTGEHDGRPYIVMERLPGETLADRIAAGPLDPAWVRQVAREVLGALAAAHKGGLVHRDVKPGNILITADGRAKIADFGIAKSLEASGDLTGTGQLLGTPAYVAPERLDGATATAKSDLYSFGVVLYEALTGRCPFPATTPLATARAVVAGDYQPLDEVRPGLDRDLVAAVEKAMATDPADRFESAEAMATAVSTEGQPTLVNGAAVGATSVMARPALHDTQVVETPLPLAPARPPSRVPMALLAALVFVALLVAALNRGDGSGSGEATAGTTPSTSAAPATTAAPSPTAALAGELRALAGRLRPSDGARAADLATLLRQVADQVEAGSGGPGATATMVSVAAWRATGQLGDAAAASAVSLLSRVPGATVVTLPARSSPPAVPAPAPAPGGNAGVGNAGGEDKGKSDDKGRSDEGKGRGKDD